MTLNLNNDAGSRKTTVFYDGSCPLCRREIKFYQGIEDANQIAWQNIATGNECNLPAGLTREAALKKFHIETAEGQVLVGAAAFAHLWLSMPRFRALGWIAQRPPAAQILDLAYVVFLNFRPTIQKFLQ